MGTLDKWNSATAKTDVFYGNPPAGFAVPLIVRGIEITWRLKR